MGAVRGPYCAGPSLRGPAAGPLVAACGTHMDQQRMRSLFALGLQTNAMELGVVFRETVRTLLSEVFKQHKQVTMDICGEHVFAPPASYMRDIDNTLDYFAKNGIAIFLEKFECLASHLNYIVPN